MGQLVFQAALGGQVNLVGPNTASTLNINVPAFAGTMASLASVNNNGVTYVNSSGQPTTLSTFVFDGANMGIGTASPSYPLDVASNSIGSGVRIRGNVSADTGILEFTNNGVTAETASIKVDGSSNIIFSNTGTIVERMRIDSSGNVGIGTTSAFGKLNVVQSSDTQIAKFSATSYGLTFSSDAGTGFRIEAADATGVGSYQPLITNGSLQAFRTGNTERMRIDTVGNVQVQAGAVMPYAPTPTSIAAATTLTNAQIQGQIINTTGTSYTVTMPLGTTLETLATWATTNVAYDFFVINTASGTITIGANSNTTLGSLTIATGVSAQFRIRRTAANTFTIYRLG